MEPRPIIGYMSLQLLFALTETGVFDYLLKHPEGVSAKELAGAFNLSEKLLKSVCDFLWVVNPSFISFDGQGYRLGEKGKNAGQKLNFTRAYKEVFDVLVPLLQGTMQYGSDVVRRGQYLQIASDIFNKSSLPVIAEYAKNISPRVMVDLGSGSGNLLLHLASLLPASQGYGIDNDPETVGISEKNIKAGGMENRIKIILEDVTRPSSWSKGIPRPEFFSAVTVWHEFLRDGEAGIIVLWREYKSLFPGAYFLMVEFDAVPTEKLINLPPSSFKDVAIFYQFTQVISNQGDPQPQEKWIKLIKEAGITLLEIKSLENNFLLYVCRF